MLASILENFPGGSCEVNNDGLSFRESEEVNHSAEIFAVWLLRGLRLRRLLEVPYKI